MSELNAEQVIKALECCASPEYKCEECPIDKQKKDDCVCGQFLEQNALALIKQLTVENEAISERYAIQVVTTIKLDKQVQRLTVENERLQKALNTDISIVRVSRGNGKTAHLRELGRIKVDAIRADTVREMAERLKARKVSYGNITFKVVPIDDIDQVAREMEEKQNDISTKT